jgi:hypothetical protein
MFFFLIYVGDSMRIGIDYDGTIADTNAMKSIWMEI